MRANNTPPTLTGPSKLLITAAEAARALSVCEKTLWSVTEPRGDLPAVRIGRRVLYSVDDLRQWIDQKKGGAPT